MKASAKHGKRLAATSPSTTQGDLTSLLTAAPRIKPTSIRCRSARQLNPRADDPLSDAEILFKGPGPSQWEAPIRCPSDTDQKGSGRCWCHHQYACDGRFHRSCRYSSPIPRHSRDRLALSFVIYVRRPQCTFAACYLSCCSALCFIHLLQHPAC